MLLGEEKNWAMRVALDRDGLRSAALSGFGIVEEEEEEEKGLVILRGMSRAQVRAQLGGWIQADDRRFQDA